MATYTFWDDSVVPPNSYPDSAIKVSLVFNVDTPGSITGVRFCKVAAATGPFDGELKQVGNSTPLATVTFTGVTSSGWQTMSFPTPVSVSPGNTYVISYNDPTGQYYYQFHYFDSQYDAGPLHALSNSAAVTAGLSGNGIFDYGGGNVGSFQATNYWVDVVFDVSSGVDRSVVASNSIAFSSVGTCTVLPILKASDNISFSGLTSCLLLPGSLKASSSLAISGSAHAILDRVARAASTLSFAGTATLAPAILLNAGSTLGLSGLAVVKRLSILRASNLLSFSGLSVGLVPRLYSVGASSGFSFSQEAVVHIGALPPPPWSESEDYGTVLCPWCWTVWKWYHPLVQDYQEHDQCAPCQRCGRRVEGLPAAVRELYLVADYSNRPRLPDDYPRIRRLTAGNSMALFGSGSRTP